VAKDVATCPGYANPREAMRQHCKGSRAMRLPTAGGMQRLVAIPESDVFRLITRSEVPPATTSTRSASLLGAGAEEERTGKAVSTPILDLSSSATIKGLHPAGQNSFIGLLVAPGLHQSAAPPSGHKKSLA